jgi:hypothetical protein
LHHVQLKAIYPEGRLASREDFTRSTARQDKQA